jgi:Transposase DDE domain
VPRAETVNTHGKQYFSRNQFSYDAASDSYRCPAGATLICQVLSDARQRKRYATSACASCPLKPQCTKGVRRLIYRSLHEDDREAMHQRAMSDPVWMKLRRELAEHPFGTIKWLMPRFLLRGLRKAKAELALSVLGYNLKRVINILGTPTLLQVLQPTFR